MNGYAVALVLLMLASALFVYWLTLPAGPEDNVAARFKREEGN